MTETRTTTGVESPVITSQPLNEILLGWGILLGSLVLSTLCSVFLFAIGVPRGYSEAVGVIGIIGLLLGGHISIERVQKGVHRDTTALLRFIRVLPFKWIKSRSIRIKLGQSATALSIGMPIAVASALTPILLVSTAWGDSASLLAVKFSLVVGVAAIGAYSGLKFAEVAFEEGKKPQPIEERPASAFAGKVKTMRRLLNESLWREALTFLATMNVQEAAQFMNWLSVERPAEAAQLIEFIESASDVRQFLAPQRYFMHSWAPVVSRIHADDSGVAFGARRRVHLALKRTIDIVVALLTLLISSATLVLPAVVIALLLSRDKSEGIFFVTPRIGLNGAVYSSYKFRVFKDADRPYGWRISRLGLFLLVSGLDRLPALVNVLRGEMSIVGPRALYPSQIREYPQYGVTLNSFAKRQLVRPGLMNMAGIQAIRSPDFFAFSTYLKFDLRYVEMWEEGSGLTADISVLAGAMRIWVGHLLPRAWAAARRKSILRTRDRAS